MALNSIGVCLGIACRAKGAIEILETITNCLKIEIGDTTPKGNFRIIPVRCIGECGKAPIVIFNEEIIYNATTHKIKAILLEKI